MWKDAETPFNDLPALPPSAQVLDDPAVLKANINAGRALAKLDGALALLPDPVILVNLIPLLESQASNEIENIVTTNDELFRAAHGALENETAQTREALRYRHALFAGVDSLSERPLTANTAKLVCTEILGHSADVRTGAGTYIGSHRTRKAIYTPPVGKEVLLNHLGAWEEFIHDHRGIDPLTAMALAHYQFEAIHPFRDGNGRTGRILNVLFLMEAGLLQYPILYISGYIVRHKDEYYRLLRGVTEDQDWVSWIIFMLEGVTSTAQWTLGIIERSVELQQILEDEIRQVLPRHVPAAELARLLMSVPYTRIETIAETFGAHRQTASGWLKKLADARVIYRSKAGRSTLFINHRLLDMLFSTPLPE